MGKPSSVAYSYGQEQQPQQGPGHVQYPSMPPQQQGGAGGAPPPPFYSQPPPPPSNNTFAVGTPAYYIDPNQQQTESCVVGPQLWLFIFGWLLAPFFFVGAMLPACVPLKPGERGLWIANLVMAIVSFTLAIIIATTVPLMKYGVPSGSGVYVYRG